VWLKTLPSVDSQRSGKNIVAARVIPAYVRSNCFIFKKLIVATRIHADLISLKHLVTD
jgi:hypothetical protein